MDRAAGGARQVQHLRVRGQRTRAVRAGVRTVIAAARRNDLAECCEFAGVGVHARGVGQAAGHADRSCAETLGENLLHADDLVGSGGPIVGSDHQQSQGALRDQVRRVGGNALIEPVEVLTDGPPGEVEVGRVAVPAGDLSADLRQHRIVHRCVAQPVLAEHLGRHALADLGEMIWRGEDLQVGVGVHVDETGRDDQTGGVDGAPSRQVGGVADPDDDGTGDGHVRGVPRRAGAVDDRPALQDEVDRRGRPRRMRCRCHE